MTGAWEEESTLSEQLLAGGDDNDTADCTSSSVSPLTDSQRYQQTLPTINSSHEITIPTREQNGSSYNAAYSNEGLNGSSDQKKPSSQGVLPRKPSPRPKKPYLTKDYH